MIKWHLSKHGKDDLLANNRTRELGTSFIKLKTWTNKCVNSMDNAKWGKINLNQDEIIKKYFTRLKVIFLKKNNLKIIYIEYQDRHLKR